VLKVGERAEES